MRIDRRSLYTALHELARVATTKTSIPILGCVLLHARDGLLTLVATDLTQRLTCQLEADGELSTCLPAKLLANLVKPEGKAAGDLVVEPLGGKQICVQLEDGITRLSCFDPTDFPAGPNPDVSPLAVWPSGPLREALEFVLPAASNDPTRPHLCVVCLTEDQLVATDGHRMHLAPLPSRLPSSLLVPASSAATILRVASAGEKVILASTKGWLRLGVGPWQLDTKLVEAVFPPHQHVVPKREDQSTQITVKTSALAKALSRLDRLSSMKQTVARVNGVLTLTVSDPDLGEAEVVVPTITNTHHGDDLVAGFDRRYLQDATATGGETIELGFSAALDPLRVDLEGDKIAVVMPMRV